MRRVAVLLVLLAFAASGCTRGTVPAADAGGHSVEMQRCNRSALPRDDGSGGTPSDPSNAATLPPPDAVAGRYQYCAQVTIRSNGVDRTVQVGAVSDRPTLPLAGRRGLVYHPRGPGISAGDTFFDDPPSVDLKTFVGVAWDGARAPNAAGSCGPADLAFGTDRNLDALSGAARAAARECKAAFGADPRAGAQVAAEELEAVRAALRIERFDLLT